MQNFGPLVQVETLTAAVDLDVQRALRFPTGSGPLTFVKGGATGWETIKTVTNGFCRVGEDEIEQGDGATVRFDVADLDGELAQAIRDASHLLFMDEYYKLNRGPAPSPDEPQVYELTCGTRTLKKQYMTQRR